MGVPPSVYTGPYAEWLVHLDEPALDRDAIASGKLAKDWGLARTWGLSFPPEIEVDGIVYQRHCYVADDERPGHPPRRLYHTDTGAMQDLRGIDFESEIIWFTWAFRDELQSLETHYTRPPRLGWGLVTWFA